MDRARLRPLAPRDPLEEHRAASPLELFTDLCYVVAIAQAALTLHHEISEGHTGHGLLFFAMSFFAIWWAWLNFAWFNSAYDNGDVATRLLTLLQILGSLVLAAGIPRFFEGDFTLGVIGYVIMRVGLILLWARAAAGHPEGRETARRYGGRPGGRAERLGARPPADGWAPRDLVVRRPGDRGLRCAVLRREGRRDPVASAPHRGALSCEFLAHDDHLPRCAVGVSRRLMDAQARDDDVIEA